jgi:hypothetical protein
MIDGTANSLRVLSMDGSSALNPYAPAMDPGTSEIVLVALATTGGIPAPNKVGKVSKVPPPATAFIAPATKLAAAKNAKVSGVSSDIYAEFTLYRSIDLAKYKECFPEPGSGCRKANPMVAAASKRLV